MLKQNHHTYPLPWVGVAYNLASCALQCLKREHLVNLQFLPLAFYQEGCNPPCCLAHCKHKQQLHIGYQTIRKCKLCRHYVYVISCSLCFALHPRLICSFENLDSSNSMEVFSHIAVVMLRLFIFVQIYPPLSTTRYSIIHLINTPHTSMNITKIKRFYYLYHTLSTRINCTRITTLLSVMLHKK